MTRFLLVLVCVFSLFDAIRGNFAAFAASSSAECCSTCIGKTADAAYTYDPVVFSQCSNVTGGVCCFECGSLGDPSYGDTISYGDDGVTAEVKAGTYISFTWSGVSNVTYISLKTGQKKTVTPTISDTAATEKSSTFLICAKAAVTASDSSTNTCNANDVVVPTSSSTGSSSIEADDTVESYWTNPPECDQWPVWKWLVTVGGGVAALFSIIISVRAFLASRKKKEEQQYRENLAPMGAKSDVETLEVTPDNGYHEKTMAPYKYDPEADRTTGGARKPEDREFTL
ncbi:Hypothetical protein PHPALM_12980 [Phytophthora palmivora]|uniref:Carbohydrate-binding protein n=1 Tax=Phytophthora palmivora TaxID=4796 RepID=A0A2P4XYK2_9STRA|nr:Hypothetical protein PHPALM_12980 [Phytophthora palmivora]